MATINLGSIKFKWKGTYSGATAYTVDDVVEYNGSSYICILASTGNLPTNATYFEQMSSAGTNGTDLTSTLTTQGDLVYRDGSGLQRLGAGTAGQVLQTGGAGANPSWTTPATAGGAISTNTMQLSGSYNTTSTSYVSFSTPVSLTVTPTSTSSKFLILWDTHTYANSGAYVEMNLFRNGSAVTGLSGFTRSNLTYWHPYGFHYLDSPNTTSSLTYEVKFRTNNASHPAEVNDGVNFASQFSVIEI